MPKYPQPTTYLIDYFNLDEIESLVRIAAKRFRVLEVDVTPDMLRRVAAKAIKAAPHRHRACRSNHDDGFALPSE